MAAPTVLTNATIWLGGYDLTASTNEVTFNAARQEKPVSRFGDTIEATYPGAQTVNAEVKGFWDSTLDGPLFTQLTAPSVGWPLNICADGSAEWSLAYGIQAYSFKYSVFEAQWGQSLPYSLTSRAGSGTSLARGRVAFNKTITTDSYGDKYQFGALSATQKMLGFVHVFSNTGLALLCRIWSDADAVAGGETDRVQWTPGLTVPHREVMSVAGPVTDTYWRFTAHPTAGAGSAKIVAVLAIVDA